MYIAPKKLHPGSRVAIVAPSSPFMSEELIEGLDIIQEYGLVPVLGPCVKTLRSDGIHAAPLADRVQELNWAFSTPTIDAVITAVGGMGSAGVLPYLDYKMIRSSKKALLGMSDITSLNMGLLAKAGLISISGQSPSIRLDKGEFIHDEDSNSLRDALSFMMSSEQWGDKPFQKNLYMPRIVSPGKASGVAVGGNTDTFVHLIGTEFMPNLDGSILFIEDVHKDGEVLARQFLHMQLAGIFDRVSGIVIGEFADVPEKIAGKVPSIEDVVQEFFVDGPPCTYGYSFSHGPYTCPIPMGAMCNIDADSGVVSFDYAMST